MSAQPISSAPATPANQSTVQLPGSSPALSGTLALPGSAQLPAPAVLLLGEVGAPHRDRPMHSLPSPLFEELAAILAQNGYASLRFDSNIHKAASDMKACGEVMGCDAFSPAHLEKTNPGLFWYGIHGVEILYTIMGPGCKTVRCTTTPDGDLGSCPKQT